MNQINGLQRNMAIPRRLPHGISLAVINPKDKLKGLPPPKKLISVIKNFN